MMYVDWENYNRHFPLVQLDKITKAKCLLLGVELHYDGVACKKIMVVKPKDGLIPLMRLFHRYHSSAMPHLFRTPEEAIAGVLDEEHYVFRI